VDSSRHARRRRRTLVLLVITSLALVSLDERGSGVINSARTAAQDVVAPIQNLADDVIDPVADWFDGLGRADELRNENEKLRRQLDAAKSEIAASEASASELETLRQLNDLPDVADADGVVAEVTEQNAGNFSRAFRISKGSDAGIELDMPVVFGAGRASALVGKVVRVSSSDAVVQRIDDATFGVGARIVQGDAGPTGTAEGQRNSNLLSFSVFGDSGTQVDLKKGDVAITLSSRGGSFPDGLVIGRVTHPVAFGGSIAREAKLRPIVDLDALTLVKVLKYPPEPAP
jgi:rod shape-determining protein MreC